LVSLSLHVLADPAPPSEVHPLPNDFIEQSTGHRVVKLSRLPGSSESQYFNQKSFSADGNVMVFTNTDPTGVRRLYSINLKTFKTHKLSDKDSSHWYMPTVAPKSGIVYYAAGDGIYGTTLDGQSTRLVAKLPADWRQGLGLTLNANETMLAGTVPMGEAAVTARYVEKSQWIPAVFAAKLRNVLYTIDIKTGTIKTLIDTHEFWLDHPQFSPTDPTLLMFCHEGPWQSVGARIWTIRTDGSDMHIAVKPTLSGEVVGHEFWSPDGKKIYYDSYIYPKRQECYVASTDLATGAVTRYKTPGTMWCLHYNVSGDQSFFAGDGWRRGRNESVPNEDLTWIFKLTPEGNHFVADKLFNLARQDYRLEPNVIITQDQKWIVFESNVSGVGQVYAVSVDKADSNAR
jgi:oligogalacturonide lyase